MMIEMLIQLAGLDGIDRLLPEERRKYYATEETKTECVSRFLRDAVCV